MLPKGIELFKSTDVEKLYRHFFRTLYNNASKLILIEGMDDDINKDFVMAQLLLTGRIAVFKNGDITTMLNCNVGGAVDKYYKPTEILIANPVLGSFNLKRDEEGFVIHLTPMDILMEYPQGAPMFCASGGIYSLIAMCSNLLADNISSINCAQINTRVHAIYTAEDSSAGKSAEIVLKNIYEGKPYSVVTSEMLSAIHVNPISNANNSKSLIELLEVCQYIFALFWNSLGIDCNYNMKRERLITAEVDKNLQSLKIPIETILDTLNKDFDKCNEKLGTSFHAIMNPEFEIEEVVTSPQENGGDDNEDEGISDTETVET